MLENWYILNKIVKNSTYWCNFLRTNIILNELKYTTLYDLGYTQEELNKNIMEYGKKVEDNIYFKLYIDNLNEEINNLKRLLEEKTKEIEMIKQINEIRI